MIPSSYREFRRATRLLIERTLGARVADTAQRAYDLAQVARRSAHPAWYRSRERLRVFRDMYKGKSCVIIGNGPSLREMDLSALEHEFTFGLNRIYMNFEQMGFSTSFLVSVNALVIEQCAEELAALKMPTFISWRGRGRMPLTDSTIFLGTLGRTPFSVDPLRHEINEGTTVTFVAMQLAFYMGFEEVVLIGVDHSFTTTGPAHKEVTSTGSDPNHFSPDYFGKGFRWQLPDLEESERSYEEARRAFERAGRRIVDATVGGKLQVFEKVDYATRFGACVRPSTQPR